MESVPSAGFVKSTAALSPPVTPPSARVTESDKVVFNCPTCGHAYRLAAELAGKQGRCTACRGVFTIPLRSSPHSAIVAPSPALAQSKSSISVARRSDSLPGREPMRRIVTAVPIPAEEDDSEFWELDSSEAIPSTAALSGRGAAGPLAMGPVPGSRAVRGMVGAQGLFTGSAAVTVKPPRPRWVTHAAIGAGVIVGSIAFGVSYTVFSNFVGSRRELSTDSPKPTSAPIAEVSRPEPGAGSSTELSGQAAHQATIDALIRAYNDIADGYAQIGDAASIHRGEERISRAVEQMKAAAHRGRSLPPLRESERVHWSAKKVPA